MAKRAPAGNTPPAETPVPEVRRAYRPRALAALLPAITRPAFKRRSPAAAMLIADWAEIVGPELAAQSVPRKLAGGTLTLACTGPMALELQHRQDMLIDRINRTLGQTVVERLRFTQDDAALLAAQAPKARPRPAAPVVLADLPEGSLREALERLGGHVAAQRRK